MPNKTNFTEEIKQFESLIGKDEPLIKKLDEFIALLENSDLDSENISHIKGRLNKTLDKKLSEADAMSQVKGVAESSLDQIERLEKLEFLLNNSQFNSTDARKIRIKSSISRFIKGVIGLLFVTLGFAMIIMPAPPYFEMFTIFYFTTDDGITLMDLISLIIVAVGIYIMINASLNLKPNE